MSDCVFQKSVTTGGAAFAQIELRMLRWLRQSGHLKKCQNHAPGRLANTPFIYSWWHRWHPYFFEIFDQPWLKNSPKTAKGSNDPPVLRPTLQVRSGKIWKNKFHLLVEQLRASLLNHWICHWMILDEGMLVYWYTRFSDTPKSYRNMPWNHRWRQNGPS